jgi:hypothetical protein
MTNPILKRLVPILSLAGVALLGACHSQSNENDIKPIRAGVATPNAVPSGPAVYLRVAASDNTDDDVVPLEVVLNPGGGTVTFDAFNLEILPTDPANPGLLRDGVVQIVFDSGAGTTPFGACNTCIATAGCGFTSPAVPPACTTCASCPALTPATGSVNTPFCFAGTSSSHSSLVSVSSVGASGCPAVSASGQEMLLGTITVFARTTGSVRLRFIDVHSNPGDCAILLSGADQGVTFDDRGAVFTAGR